MISVEFLANEEDVGWEFILFWGVTTIELSPGSTLPSRGDIQPQTLISRPSVHLMQAHGHKPYYSRSRLTTNAQRNIVEL